MFRVRLVPQQTSFNFLGFRRIAFAVSGTAIVASLVLLIMFGLNFGIDFRGGILIETRSPVAADIAAMRSAVSSIGLGDVSLQEFGDVRDVLIRVEAQPGDEQEQMAAADAVKAALGAAVGELEYRRVEFVGPKVSAELVADGVIAVLLALAAMLVYIWLRFEWQFGVGALVALTHDVILTLGVFALVQLEFNLSIIAAILTIIGYSLNDTVVVFDRIRENLRKYRSMELVELLNLSTNDTLSRTTMTSFTTLLALIALFVFGGEVIRGFTFAMIWGILVGTYSSIYVAAPTLVYLGIHRGAAGAGDSASEKA